MKEKDDKQLGMGRRITRRDFLNGVAQTTLASLSMPLWMSMLEASSEDYPPALTGLRGSNEGSFEVAHQLKDGKFSQLYGAPEDTGEVYDLVVVGAGISGLAAAWFYRKAAGPNARILILDNHDDFGGHARRQEFGKGDSLMLGHGGSFAIESPAPYSPVSKSLIEELAIDVESFRKHTAREVYASKGLNAGFFFDQATFGSDILLPDPYEQTWEGSAQTASDAWPRFLEKSPWSDSAKKDLHRLHNEPVDHFPGLTSKEKKEKLARISYSSYLTDIVKCDPSILPFFQARPHSLYGAGIDIVPAQDAWGLGYPGFAGLKLDPEPGIGMNRDSIWSEEAEHYFFHFPDGNATIARLLIRKLIPEAITGKDAEDIVTARAHYGKLDLNGAATRVRLSSTVVRVQENDKKEVHVSYVRNGKLSNVRASRCVLACWHAMIPFLCPELPRDQQTALAYAIKIPLLYTRIAVRNWHPWVKLGVQSVYAPGNYFTNVQLPMALKFDGYRTAQSPEDPVMLGMFRAPCKPGLPVRHQHRIGRKEILETTFQDFERKIREELTAILGPAGFDPATDITAIAVHRWPHGYAYQYNSLFDPFWMEGKEGPCVTARQPFGRIAIANSDAGAYAYVDSAIDQAHRAVQEILLVK